MPVSSVQYGQAPWGYINGLGIANDAVSPDEIVNVAVGSCLDSTNVYQLEVDEALSIDVRVRGLNGLDQGTVAASSLYAIYVIADPITQQAIGGMLSLASNSAPLMPFGYSAYKLIGYVATDSSSDFLVGYWTAGNSGRRTFMYDAPQATAVTAGAATVDTAVALTAFCPPVANNPVYIKFTATPSAPARVLTLKTFGATGSMYQVSGQVATVAMIDTVLILSAQNAAAPSIEYLWSAGGGDAVALNVAGYDFFV